MSILTIYFRKTGIMGRPSLAEVRRSEILDAFASCIVSYGLDGSSLERVADEAGVKRSIIRHYIGNRDDLVDALAERVTAQYRAHLAEFVSGISDRSRVRQLLDFLFPKASVETTQSILVFESLIAAGERYPNVRTLMLDYVEHLVDQIADQLRLEYPTATRSRCWNVAYGVVGICFNQESLSPLGLSNSYLKAARQCSELLIRSLGH